MSTKGCLVDLREGQRARRADRQRRKGQSDRETVRGRKSERERERGTMVSEGR